jgi:hypothetical protein
LIGDGQRHETALSHYPEIALDVHFSLLVSLAVAGQPD